MVLPGWGQLATDRPFLGWTFILISLGAAASAIGAVTRLGMVDVAARMAQPDVLAGLLALNLVVAAGRVTVCAHAWRTGGGRGWPGAMLLSLLVLVPHLLIGWAAWATRDTLLDVFSGPTHQPDPPPMAAAGITTPPVTTTAPPVATTGSPTTTSVSTTTTTTPASTAGSTSTLPATTTTPTTTTTPPATTTTPTATTTTPPATTGVPLGGERLNLLILGGDAGPGRFGLRTDTMMVGSVDPAGGDAALFGLPRNFGGFTFSDGTPFPGRILNEVYAYGKGRPERFDGVDPGASAISDVVEHLTGLAIDHFVLVDMTGFGEVVDAFGGATLTVPEPVYGPLYDPGTGEYEMIRIEAGEQTLDGDLALAYARSRLDSSDYARMARQRCLLTAMVDDLDPVGLLGRWPALLETIETHLATDLPLDLVPELIRLGGDISAAEVRVVGFGPDWSVGRTPGGYPIPDVERIRETVTSTIADPSATGDPALPTGQEACG